MKTALLICEGLCNGRDRVRRFDEMAARVRAMFPNASARAGFRVGDAERFLHTPHVILSASAASCTVCYQIRRYGGAPVNLLATHRSEIAQ